MNPSSTLATLRDEWAHELTGHLLPYWSERAVDRRHGGFVGRITADGRAVDGAPKAAVLHTRILWTFAAASRVLETPRYRALAERAFAYLMDRFWDAQHGGVFWMVDHDGTPRQTKKQVYAQAFGIYALAEYYRATGESESRDGAVQLFRLLETHAFDPEHGGYYESYSRTWEPLGDMRLSEQDPDEKKSLNTHLHVMEAYANLYRIWPNERLAEQLRALIERFLHGILDPETTHLGTFFSETWERRSARISFGHDIEASWLLTEAADVLGRPDLQASARKAAVRIARATRRDGVEEDHGMPFEAGPQGVTDADRHWWPQAEAVIGFLNAYGITRETAFLKAAAASWAYIQRHFVDREHGEWFLRVASDGRVYRKDDKVGPWKGPYHGVRACLEGIARADRLRAEVDGQEGADVRDRYPQSDET